jgi:microcystin-dependent protein
MAIKLRVNQATALTYNEMDRNFSSLFYSASVDANNFLHLWYTGSSALNSSGENYEPHSVPINLQPTTGIIPTLVVAQPIRSLQYNDNGTQLGASSELIYSTDGYLGVGVGAPVKKLHIRGNSNTPATLQLESIATQDNVNRKSTVEFYQGTVFTGLIGRDNYADNNLYIKTFKEASQTPGNLIINIGGTTTSAAFTPAGLGIGILIPVRELHVVGEGYFTGKLGVGTVSNGEALNVFQNTQLQATSGIKVDIAKLGIRPGSGYTTNNLNITTARTSAGSDWTTSGMRLQQQVDNTYMSYLQFSGDGNNYGISIGAGGADTAQIGVSYNDVPEVLRIDAGGNVGINTKTSTEKLTVKGNISGSGFIKVDGNATIGGTATVGLSLTTGTTAAVGTNLTVGGTATIGNIPSGTVGAGTKILTANNDGQIQYITNIVPKGAIMMWGGLAQNSITPPPGWRLCDGDNSGNTNGVTIPDLRERFIVGAGGDNTYVADGTGYGVGDVGGGNSVTLNVTQIPAHGHSLIYGAGGVGTKYPETPYISNIVGGAAEPTGLTGGGQSHENRPPYYALAFIIYTGV